MTGSAARAMAILKLSEIAARYLFQVDIFCDLIFVLLIKRIRVRA
jgi:hypothetical protein